MLAKKRIWIIFILVLAVTVILAALIRNSHKSPMTYQEKVEAFASENPSLKTGQIVFVGDSITAGYSLRDDYSELDKETYNRGISGDTAGWLISRIKVSVFDISPSVIVLMIGTNDINDGKSPSEIAEAYDCILEDIQAALPQTEVFCVSIVPQGTKYSEHAAENNLRIRETNEKIEALAAAHGYEYINLYDRMTDKNGMLKRRYTTDGLHLRAAGYRVWTETMRGLLD